MKCFAGFKKGKIATVNMHTEEGMWPSPELFPNREWAEVYFKDVRLVEIKEVKK